MESVCRGNSTEGSNPSLSASLCARTTDRAHHLDCVAGSTLPLAASVSDPVNGDSLPDSPELLSYAAMAGYPSINLPVGFMFGLPLGLCFVGPAWSEPTLIKIAYATEQATKARKPPRFLPTVNLDSSL